MNHKDDNGLDELDFKILSELQKDGRMSFTDMADNLSRHHPHPA